MSARDRGRLFQLASALIFVLSLILVNANVESGMNDDWSFVLIARDLAATGHFHYNGWAAPLIGFQAFWAALFIKVFGFSFLAARASVWVLTLLAIPVLWQLLQLIELTQVQVFMALNFFLLSPLVLPNVATFMTDLPAFYLFSAALLCAFRAWKAVYERDALFWIAASTVFAILSGSVRQIYWLAGLCFLLTLLVVRVRSLVGKAFVVACIVCVVVFGAVATWWLAHQPYVPADTTIAALRNSSWRQIANACIGNSIRNFTGLAVLCLPFTLPCVWIARRRSVWLHVSILGISALIPYRFADPVPWLGNTITNYGVILSGTVSLGDKPEVLSGPLMFILATTGLMSAFYASMIVMGCLRRSPRESGVVRFAVFTLPFLLLYTFVIAARGPAFGIYDRYLIPCLFIVLSHTVSVCGKSYQGFSFVTLSTGMLFTLYSIASTHDYFSETQARLEATKEVLSAGNDRTSIMSGFEFDSWTQVEHSGFVNNEQVKFPANAYRQLEDCNGSDDLQSWWRPMVPALRATYIITLTPIAGMQPTAFRTIDYWRWLPMGLRHVYVEKVDANDSPLVCKPDTGMVMSSKTPTANT